MPQPTSGTRCERFLEFVEPSIRVALAGDPSLSDVLDELLATARCAWPELSADEAAFIAHLARCVSTAGVKRRSAAELRQIHAADLYLVFGALSSDEQAVRALDGRYSRLISHAIAERFRVAPALLDELQQVIRERLLLERGKREPLLYRYAGRGPLGAWLRTVSLRLAGRALRKEQRFVQDRRLAPQPEAPTRDIELLHLKRRYGEAFQVALKQAVVGLEPRERRLIALQLVHGLDAAKIGRMHDVHRTTASRWLSAVRQKVLLATRDYLVDKTGMSPDEFNSIKRALLSQLRLSLGGVTVPPLGRPDEP